MNGYNSNAAKALGEIVIPSLVDLFYVEGEANDLKAELQGQVVEMGKDLNMNLTDLFFMMNGTSSTAIFKAISIMASGFHVVGGFDDFLLKTGKLTERTIKERLGDDPIVQAKEGSSITPELYREYASFWVRNLAASIMLQMFEPFFEVLPNLCSDYLEKPLWELKPEFMYYVMQEEREPDEFLVN
jgi:hypothetical protein